MSTTVENPVLPTVDALRAFCVSVLAKVGVSAAHSATTADALVQADAWGVFTHGTKLLRGYVRRLNAGGFRSDVEPVVISEGPAWGLVDGHSALGQVTGAFAMRTAIRKAQSAGIGYVGVRNSNHFAAAGYYSWLAAREGLIGIAMCNDNNVNELQWGCKNNVVQNNTVFFRPNEGRRRTHAFGTVV